MNEFIVPSQNFFNNSSKSLSDNNRFYLDNNAESSDEMNSNVDGDVDMGLPKRGIYFFTKHFCF